MCVVGIGDQSAPDSREVNPNQSLSLFDADSPVSPLRRIELSKPHIREYPSLEELHHIETGPDDAVVHAQTKHPGDGYVVLLPIRWEERVVVPVQSREDGVFPIDAVGRGGE